MKKTSLKLILFAFVCSFIFAISGCFEEHRHTFEKWEIETEATCEHDGTKKATCTTCGEVVTETTPKTGHKEMVVNKGYDATCDNEGLTDEIECEVCGKTLQSQEIIKALGHSWSPWQPSKTDINKHYRVCENDPNHIEEDECLFDTNRVEATCDMDGYIEHRCEECNRELEKVILPALGHEYSDDAWQQVIVGSTNETEEHTHMHARNCKRCGYLDEQACVLEKEKPLM